MTSDIVGKVDMMLETVLRARALPPAMFGMMAYHMGWMDEGWKEVSAARRARYGGKKMRAVLCALACEAAGGRCETAIPAAAAVELVQNFSLVHDDIEDGDRERRHRPTVWVNWGVPQAINTGSAMQALVNAAVLRTEAPPDIVLDLLRGLTDAMVEMTEGQHLDIAFQSRDVVAVEEYEDMASRKTGALMEAAAYTGARLGTSDDARLAAWRRFGRAFGQAFQARDDLLGVTGDPRLTGKPVGNDIRTRKKALPLVFACAHTSAADLARIHAALAEEPVSNAAVHDVTAILERSGALDATREAVERFTALALTALEETKAAGAALTAVRDMVLHAVGREQ